MPLHDARDVANQIIRRAAMHRRTLTPMQVLKLVYMSQGWMLGLYGRPLFSQSVEAWQYGPVIPDVYHALKGYGSSPVLATINCPQEHYDPQEIDIINQVVDIYKDWNGIELSNWTHQPGSPWHTTWHINGRNSTIPIDTIQAYFNRLAHESARQ
ncbi:SocA family protein [Azospirillum sp. ROY-1-1-2]|uniref:SocA family protein n=2 Tax=Azospirillum oleiclasticum TaxID=2735135 RepID=A0ABX2TIR6_9PROT|nr:type II toxin-antitoxin system antitoxin SocA domain-containing protein [Azospirillum oleiclasticum]NYZ24121.1 SocA family protein [Azospirillum oleiclasticum]